MDDQPPVPGGTTAIRDGQYASEPRAPGPPIPPPPTAVGEVGPRPLYVLALEDAIARAVRELEPLDHPDVSRAIKILTEVLR